MVNTAPDLSMPILIPCATNPLTFSLTDFLVLEKCGTVQKYDAPVSHWSMVFQVFPLSSEYKRENVAISEDACQMTGNDVPARSSSPPLGEVRLND